MSFLSHFWETKERKFFFLRDGFPIISSSLLNYFSICYLRDIITFCSLVLLSFSTLLLRPSFNISSLPTGLRKCRTLLPLLSLIDTHPLSLPCASPHFPTWMFIKKKWSGIYLDFTWNWLISEAESYLIYML